MNRKVEGCMKKAAILILCAALSMVVFLSAATETEAGIISSVGSFTLTDGMVRLYCLQDEAAKAIVAKYGLSASAVDQTPVDTHAVERWLETACAAAQAALDTGISISADTVEEIIKQELVSYPSAQGQEYFAEYARFVRDGFGKPLEELVSAAVTLRRVQMLAERYLSVAANGRLKGRTDEAAARLLAVEFALIPCARVDGADCKPSIEWLQESIFLLRGFK